jgi:nuclear pore complex protein Nup205
MLDAVAPAASVPPAASVADLPPLAAAITQIALFHGGAGTGGGGGGVDFDYDYDGGGGGVEQPRLAALELLATLPPPPLQPLAAAAAAAAAGSGAHGLSTDAAQLQRELRVGELLSDRRPVEAGGCLEVTTRGDAVISIRALGARLLEESRRVSAAHQGPLSGGGYGGGGFGGGRGGGSGGESAASAARLRDAHKAAVQSAVRQARAFNAAVEEHAAHVHVVSAWAALMATLASRCLPVGGPCTPPEEDPQAKPYTRNPKL